MLLSKTRAANPQKNQAFGADCLSPAGKLAWYSRGSIIPSSSTADLKFETQRKHLHIVQQTKVSKGIIKIKIYSAHQTLTDTGAKR